MSHIYSDKFFDYIDEGARSSARRVISLLQPLVKARSVADFGSGRGVWAAEWRAAGVDDVLAIDGDYVDRSKLAVPGDSFHAADLTRELSFGRRFDLAQSLEVGEHLPTSASETLVESLVRHSDIVLFSAAVPGQGGEFHVNEQPLSFWQSLFAARGYDAFDYLRPLMENDKSVEPWYRYNTVLYANAEGQKRLPQKVIESRVPKGERVKLAGDLPWRLRRAVVSFLPRSVVTWIARTRAAFLARRVG